MQENLIGFICTQPDFFTNRDSAIKAGFKKAENIFTEIAKSKTPIDNSGCCATIALIDRNFIHVANLGDCRIVAGLKGGALIKQLSNDHKPSSNFELERILENGGSISKREVITTTI